MTVHCNKKGKKRWQKKEAGGPEKQVLYFVWPIKAHKSELWLLLKEYSIGCQNFTWNVSIYAPIFCYLFSPDYIHGWKALTLTFITEKLCMLNNYNLLQNFTAWNIKYHVWLETMSC